NAGLFAVAMLAATDSALADKLDLFRTRQTEAAASMKLSGK
ncbi:MAG: 5-(carboxyamino)imidazole ribonucleotide mutase, partial [Burkholderiaceae bacterium]